MHLILIFFPVIVRLPSEAGKSFPWCVHYVNGNDYGCAQHPKNCSGIHIHIIEHFMFFEDSCVFSS